MKNVLDTTIKRLLIVLMLISFVTTNALALDSATGNDLSEGLADIRSVQSKLDQLSNKGRAASRKISLIIKQINGAINNPGNSCTPRLKSALLRLNKP